MKVFVALLGCLVLDGWADARVLDTSSNASLPVSSCDASVGLLCLPNACEKNSCSLMPDAKCIADRCGCEARFFKWNQQDRIFQDYSRMCHVSNYVANVQRFIERVEQNDEAAATDPKVLLDLFRGFNNLVVEIMLDLARHISDVAKTDPSDMKVAKLREVLKTLRSLHRGTREVSDEDDVQDEDIQERFPSWLKKTFKVVKNILKNDSTYADEIASGKVAISDKKVRENLATQSRKMIDLGRIEA